ncbi:MAG: cation acetate symporter [Planctomycetaceae bacterium]|nr:cation acetate symporter [Planctomycetaceae bacterium]
MTHEASALAVAVFAAFVGLTLGISFYMGRKAKSSEGYFAAHGQIPWFVNGVAFAGDYLSAASFLGICGMIAFYGYDGFLYSIGYLAGWIVALFVIAEPMKRLGKFTFADALDSRFQSRGIRLAAGVSTLAVSVFYLIPQMVGAGVLVKPLLGMPHWAGVVIVGTVVILIVVTAGMVSTTWVQFLKGALLVVFSTVLVVMILQRGFKKDPDADAYFATLGPITGAWPEAALAHPHFGDARLVDHGGAWLEHGALHVEYLQDGQVVGAGVFNRRDGEQQDTFYLDVAQAVFVAADGTRTTLGGFTTDNEQTDDVTHSPLEPVGRVTSLPDSADATGPVGPIEFFSTLQNSEVVLWGSRQIAEPDGGVSTLYYQKPTPGSHVLRPGEHPRFQGIRSDKPLDKLNFLSLMLALFCGTASLPHILIRYYTVKDEAAARKSTIVGIATIGFFYILTLYMGLGAMTSGAMDVTDSNMAAPLLARSMSETLFAVISAIAFTTVLGTVSGLILASAGAVAHDLYGQFVHEELSEYQQVRLAKIASVVIGALAIALGILFKGMNVSYLVGWAFSVAASANLPALVMTLFWRRVTAAGITAAVIVGMVSSLGWILLSADSYEKIYGLPASEALAPFSQPGIVTIPLGFVVVIVVSLLTQKQASAE